MNISFFKKQPSLLAFFILGTSVFAQPVPKTIIVEHFTNTYCSVCASRNPGFYSNLNSQPGILHIAFHPSSPYAACTLNKYNKAENDARTTFYGIYGSTPRLVIQGKVLSSGANYSDSAIFNTSKNKFSSFQLKIAMKPIGDSIQMVATIVKKDTSTLSAATFFAAIIQKEVNFTSNNGETSHHDVFRSSFSGSDPLAINLPMNINDSVIIKRTILKDPNWMLSGMYPIGILQNTNKEVLQIASGLTIPNVSSVNNANFSSIHIYPNPFTKNITIDKTENGEVTYQITSINGKLLLQGITQNNQINNLQLLNAGLYILITNFHNKTNSFLINKN